MSNKSTILGRVSVISINFNRKMAKENRQSRKKKSYVQKQTMQEQKNLLAFKTTYSQKKIALTVIILNTPDAAKNKKTKKKQTETYKFSKRTD